MIASAFSAPISFGRSTIPGLSLKSHFIKLSYGRGKHTERPSLFWRMLLPDHEEGTFVSVNKFSLLLTKDVLKSEVLV